MPLEDTEGFTEMAMGPQTQNQVPMGSPHQDAHMLAEFYLHPQEDSAKSEELGRPYFVDREYVRITQPGNKNSIIERPIRFGQRQKTTTTASRISTTCLNKANNRSCRALL